MTQLKIYFETNVSKVNDTMNAKFTQIDDFIWNTDQKLSWAQHAKEDAESTRKQQESLRVFVERNIKVLVSQISDLALKMNENTKQL